MTLRLRLAVWLGLPAYAAAAQKAADEAKLSAEAAKVHLLRAEKATAALYKAITAAEKRQAKQQEPGWDDDLESLDSMRSR